jgi:hypothetical protein
MKMNTVKIAESLNQFGSYADKLGQNLMSRFNSDFKNKGNIDDNSVAAAVSTGMAPFWRKSACVFEHLI